MAVFIPANIALQQLLEYLQYATQRIYLLVKLGINYADVAMQ
jgi:hypothetical protein